MLGIKKRGLITLLIFLVTIVASAILFWNTNSNYLKSKGVNESDWAFYNYGQEICGKKGTKGVDVGIVNVWKLQPNIKSTIVGLVDTGVEVHNKEIQMFLNKKNEIMNNLDDDRNKFVDDIYGWDFYNNDQSIYDGYLYDYHGTYLLNEIKHVNPNIEFVIGKFLSGSSGDATDAVKAIQYCIDRGAKIINCSWAFYEEDKKLLNIIKYNPDVMFVCAAGNANVNLDRNNLYPAVYELDNVITVLAVDNHGDIYDCSGYGEKVDIAAPGVGIEVDLPENDTAILDGTSIATAYVTAAVSILKGYNEQLTMYEIKDILIKSAKHIEQLEGLCKACGVLDIEAALKIIDGGKI